MASVKSIKTELFLIRRLLQEGYGPRYWWPYFKNRFLGNYLIRFLPRFDYQADPDLELHTISGKKGLWMLAWMLRSTLIMSKLKPVIVIHDDGTLDKYSEKLIKSKFANVNILFRRETTKKILAMPDVPDIVKKARAEGHFFLDKLISIFLFSKAKRILASDTDVLYYGFPAEVVDFMLGRSSCDALLSRSHGIVSPYGDSYGSFDLMMDEYYVQKYKPQEKDAVSFNGGYLAVDREKLNLNQLVEFLNHTNRPFNDYFIEMACWACVLSQLNFAYLPNDRYSIKGPVTEKTIFKHFTSPRRYEMFAYGIDLARKKMGE